MDSYVPSGYEYDTAGSGNFTHQMVMKVCQSSEELRVVEYAMLIGLIPQKMFCPSCANPMKMYRRNEKHINQFEWRCHKQRCDKTLSVLSGTVFAGAKLPLATLIMVLFYFANEEPAKKVKEYLKISERQSRNGSMFVEATVQRKCYELT
ncbi:hypothetical protein PINS_up017519 [Pythium insidiosum]|nr:hypothetical protein PINS_up017519 [Pythium insidiosum]